MLAVFVFVDQILCLGLKHWREIELRNASCKVSCFPAKTVDSCSRWLPTYRQDFHLTSPGEPHPLTQVLANRSPFCLQVHGERLQPLEDVFKLLVVGVTRVTLVVGAHKRTDVSILALLHWVMLDSPETSDESER